MLDEPSLGLAPLIARQIFDAIRVLNRQDGLTVLIVEQNANHALKLAHRGYVMVNGLITLAGTGAELAVADLNAAGGVNGKKLALDVEDDACDPKQARSVAEKISSAKMPFVAGHYCSSSSIPASE